MQDLDLPHLKQIALQAGKKILEIYHDADFSGVVDFKEDNSPLTIADKASHEVILRELQKAFPGIPVISEEGAEIAYEERKGFEKFWLVDPLDGTKEFIKRNGEFTVNIALIVKKKPVFGIIYVPVKDIMYWTDNAGAAFKKENGEETPLAVRNARNQLTAVRSASHASPEEDQVLSKYDIANTISRGSSLKFCMVAEGKADIYYRHGPTMEWDTAAGQAIVEAAGGVMFDATLTNPFSYNKEILRNGSFLCLGFQNS
jgi:3'(2'), 5'-bisphosphate nucleotidase